MSARMLPVTWAKARAVELRVAAEHASAIVEDIKESLTLRGELVGSEPQ